MAVSAKVSSRFLDVHRRFALLYVALEELG